MNATACNRAGLLQQTREVSTSSVELLPRTETELNLWVHTLIF